MTHPPGQAVRRPRILFVITLAETGGAQTYVANLLPALEEGFELLVAAHGPGPLREAATAAGARFLPLRHVRRALHPWHDLAGLLEVIAILRRVRPDIVHANSSKAGILARVAGVVAGTPIRVFTVHGWAFSANAGLVSAFYRWADRLMSPLTTVTICVAESELRAGLEARTCDPERTHVIRNGVDIEAARPQLRVDGKPPVVVSVGRLKAPKDFVSLVRSLAEIRPRPFHALIVGDGPDRVAVEKEIRRLDLVREVELLGERRDVSDLLAASDVFVLSSDSEGLPMSILEAMANGLPVVATAVGGVPEVVLDGETGFLVPPGDSKRLAAALARLVDDAGLRRSLGDAGRRRVEEAGFDLRSFQRAHVELYRCELAERGLPLPGP